MAEADLTIPELSFLKGTGLKKVIPFFSNSGSSGPRTQADFSALAHL